MKALLKRQEIRFLLVGGLNTIVGYGLYAILVFFNINYLIANTISTIIGVLHSYLWNRFFTFKSKEKALKEILKFVSVYIVSYLLGMGTLFAFKEVLNLSPYIAGFINLFITTLISWFGHKYFSFNNKKMNIKKWIVKHKNILITLGIFVFSFLLLLMYKNVGEFTDEGDVMLGAKMLSEGKLIYLDFASQHLPFTYFIFAPFALLGVNTVLGFRLSMYFILAIIWSGMYLRYAKKIGSLPMILYPLLYIIFMHVSDFTSATVVSEQIQSQCLVILFLEIILFYKNKKLDLLGKILIPLNIVFAIGTAFVSIIPCFIAVIALFYIDCKIYYQENNKSLKNYISHFFKEYKLVLILGFGLILLFILYLYFTNSLEECYKQAFYLNTEVYSKYNGYSSNPFKTILLIIPRFLMRLPNYLQLHFINILYLILWLGVGFFFYKFFKKEKVLAILLILFILLCGNRAFEGMHALPYYAAAIIGFLYACKDFTKKEWFVALCIIFLIFFKQCGPFIKNIYLPVTKNTEYYEILRKIDDSPYSLHIDIETTEYIYSNTLPYSKFAGIVPWYAEVYETEYLEDIKKTNAKILFYNPEYTVWSYKFKDFIPNIHKYVLKNYTYVPIYEFWVQNTKIKEVENILNIDLAEYNNTYIDAAPFVLQNNELEQIIVPEENIKKIGFKVGTYNRQNYSLINLEIIQENEVIFQKEIPASMLKDNEMFYIECDLEKNEEYTIRFTSENTNVNDYIAIYKIYDEENTDANYLKINGVTYQEDLVMEMFYE